MQQRRYDILFNGAIADGFDIATVKGNLAKLFKLSPEAVDKLFSGNTATLKKDIDRQTAIKYQNVLQKAGARIQIKLRVAEGAPAPGQARPATATEKAAPAMTAAPESAAAAKPAHTAKTAPPVAEAEPPAAYSLSLAPAGGDLLRANEKPRRLEQPPVDISHLKLSSLFSMNDGGDKKAETPPIVPDISHLSTAPVGEDLLPDKPAAAPVAVPDVSAISIAEAGADLLTEDQRQHIPAMAPDISAISLAPPGGDLLTEQEKPQRPEVKIDTSQLKLADS